LLSRHSSDIFYCYFTIKILLHRNENVIKAENVSLPSSPATHSLDFYGKYSDVGI